MKKSPYNLKSKKSSQIVAKNVTGSVKWFNVKCGFGFICRHDTKGDVFIHQSGILKNNSKKFESSVDEGEIVEFDVVKSAKGYEAINVTGPNGAPVKGSRYAFNKTSNQMQGLPRFLLGKSNKNMKYAQLLYAYANQFDSMPPYDPMYGLYDDDLNELYHDISTKKYSKMMFPRLNYLYNNPYNNLFMESNHQNVMPVGPFPPVCSMFPMSKPRSVPRQLLSQMYRLNNFSKEEMRKRMDMSMKKYVPGWQPWMDLMSDSFQNSSISEEVDGYNESYEKTVKQDVIKKPLIIFGNSDEEDNENEEISSIEEDINAVESLEDSENQENDAFLLNNKTDVEQKLKNIDEQALNNTKRIKGKALCERN